MCHVLIIEDEPLIAILLRDILEDEGASSFAFADTEASAIASAMVERPALITSDVKLLSGTGPQAVSAIHEQFGDIPVIFITATVTECRPCNPSGRVLEKPVNHRALVAAFHEMVPA